MRRDRYPRSDATPLPFLEEIMATIVARKIQVHTMDAYDDKTNPEDHHTSLRKVLFIVVDKYFT